MVSPRVIAAATVLLLAGCGRVAELQPAAGKALPVKPLMAKTTPTAEELLAIPTYARADRVDELMKRSEPRPQDPFNLPPAVGGSAPIGPAADPHQRNTSIDPVSNGE